MFGLYGYFDVWIRCALSFCLSHYFGDFVYYTVCFGKDFAKVLPDVRGKTGTVIHIKEKRQG